MKPDTGRIGPEIENLQNSLDWSGVYAGVVPCADCDGIAVELTLNSNFTYIMKRTYEGKSSQPFTNSGSFTWNKIGTQVTLNSVNEGGAFEHYLVQENKLILLDINGELVSSPLNNYTLTKTAKTAAGNSDLTNRRWKLVELMGKPVVYSEGQTNEAFISFKTDGKVSGNLGCNTFSGTYTLQDGNRIRFSETVSTLKMCLDMATETEFKKILEIADNYNLDGDILVLNRARMAPLARFEAVYMN
jgi:heat shock protein HslJ